MKIFNTLHSKWNNKKKESLPFGIRVHDTHTKCFDHVRFERKEEEEENFVVDFYFMTFVVVINFVGEFCHCTIKHKSDQHRNRVKVKK